MIETIHVINLDRNQPTDPYAPPKLTEEIKASRDARALSVVKQSKLYGFAVRFWPGIISEKNTFPAINITRAFKKIVQHAREEKLPMVTIAEDDFVFTSKQSWKYYLENLPDEFDMYLGGVYHGEIDGNRLVGGYSGNTLITIHERFYDFFLTAEENNHLDRWLGEFCMEKLYLVTIPFVVKQMWGYSDCKRRKVTYEMHENWEYYHGV